VTATATQQGASPKAVLSLASPVIGRFVKEHDEGVIIDPIPDQRRIFALGG
jgi:hypothetical protein